MSRRASMDDPLGLADAIVGQADGGEEVEAYVVRRRDVEIQVYGGDIESFSTAEVAGVGVRVIRGERLGFAYSGTADAEAGAEVLHEARDNAVYGTTDSALGLIRPEEFPSPRPELDLSAPEFDAFSSEAKMALVLGLEKDLKERDPRIRSVQAEYGDANVRRGVANSRGVRDEQERTISAVAAYAVVEEDGQTQTGFGYDLNRDPAGLRPEAVAAEAAERSLRLLGAKQPKTQRVPVVLDQFVTASLLGVVAATLNGESVMKGRSIFGDRLGDAVVADCVTLVDDPTDVAAFGATAFDAEGVPTMRVELIDGGVLRRFAQNVYTANRLDTTTTGSAVRGSYKSTPGVGVRALGLVPGDASLAELLSTAEGGMYIQSVQGMHSGVNPVSGDFSVGAEGCRIRDGELAEPFREATMASTLQRMLLGIDGVGDEVRMLAGGPSVHLLLGEMTIGGR